ncbi:MAG: cobalamin-binding protein [Methylococcales bacterium]|jgi:iron complex transport system substrate-binding protein|nr:cobalamin-binding protein [Methylococcales bacterium]MBT7410294.1 cobalamin-binding protein [Methylococcales bacterium]
MYRLIYLLPIYFIVTVIVQADDLVLIKPAQRIVSLAPHITESLFSAGAGDKIVGVVSYSNYPEAAKKIKNVGSYNRLNLELILSLKPDLVVAWHSVSSSNTIEKLKAFGVPVYLSDPTNLLDIARDIETYGRLAGTADVAKKTAELFRKKYHQIQQRYRGQSKVDVYYQIWKKPMMTINKDHFISQVIQLCGGDNVFGNVKVLTPTISTEAVLDKNPAMIVVSGMGQSRPEWLCEWQSWQQIRAVKNNYLYFINPDLMQRPTMRILQGAEKLCQQIDEVRNQYAKSPSC